MTLGRLTPAQAALARRCPVHEGRYIVGTMLSRHSVSSIEGARSLHEVGSRWTLGKLVRKGWLEQVVDDVSQPIFKVTDEGRPAILALRGK